MQFRLLTITALGLALATQVAEPQCPPDGFSESELRALKSTEFSLEPAQARNALAVALAECTGYPDPDIRDGIAYTGLATWLRGEKLSSETIHQLREKLTAQLETPPDEAGFRRPFAALILSEVVRTDRVSPLFTEAQREQLVKSAAAYLASVNDYRGFSDQDGWRHGVAHGADLVLQLVLNEVVTAEQVEILLDAVAGQVAPPHEHFYVYGEPARLARPVFYAFQRQLLGNEWWSAWLQQVTNPSPLSDWGQAWSSNAGLAKRHNTQAFLLALHFNAVSAGEAGRDFSDMILEAMKRL